eukprot:351146-Chlamydomonas_euryale.AAC.2
MPSFAHPLMHLPTRPSLLPPPLTVLLMHPPSRPSPLSPLPTVLHMTVARTTTSGPQRCPE